MNKSNYYYSQNLVFKIPLKKSSDLESNDSKKEEKLMSTVIMKLRFYDKENKNIQLLPVFPTYASLFSLKKI